MINLDPLNFVMELIFNVVILFFNIMLAPVNIFIETCLPWLDSIFNTLNSLFDLVIPYFSWIVSLFGLPPAFIYLLVFYITFKVSSTFAVWVIKHALSWYNALKP